MAKTPPYLQFSMKLMRKRGFVCEKTEQKIGNPRSRFMTSRDLFGWMDAIAFGNGKVVGVQATSAKQLYKHRRKYETDPDVKCNIRKWLNTSDALEAVMHAWKKVKNKWVCDEHHIYVDDEGELVWVKEGADLS